MDIKKKLYIHRQNLIDKRPDMHRKQRIHVLISAIAIIISPFMLPQMSAQEQVLSPDELMLKNIYKTSLKSDEAYNWLRTLTQEVGHRLSGSERAAEAVQLMKSIMDTMAFDRVFLQEVMVPHWVRGQEEVLRINFTDHREEHINCMAIGNSIGTGPDGISGKVIEVHSLEEVKEIPEDEIKGNIIFYNRPMDSLLVNTFHAYGGAVRQRVLGSSEAAKYGAAAVIVRSMTTETDDVIHTGTLYYRPEDPKIPAFNISTRDADYLSALLKKDKVISVFLRSTCKMLDDVLSYNVIGEITGSEYPDEIILVGGHLDSWDVGQGAHDDGAGCVHAMSIVDIFSRLNYKPKRTLRVVLFMNEENGGTGADKYAEVAKEKQLFHLAAIESDAGGFTPRGFGFDAHPDVKEAYLKKVRSWQDLFIPYDISLRFGGSGADVSDLKFQKGLLGGLRPDSQRYFDYHHTAEDTFDKINKRELKLGCAAMASLVYLLDKHGLQ